MIRCDEVRPQLEAYYDEECPPEQRKALEEHLAACASCRELLDQWVHLSLRVFPSDRVKAPPYLWTRVLAGIEAREAAQAVPWWIQWRWMSRVTAAASLLVTVGSVLLFRASVPTLDTLLEGETPQQQAILVAMNSSDPQPSDNVVMEGETWAQN